MSRKIKKYIQSEPLTTLKERLLRWGNNQKQVVFLNNNDYQDNYHSYEFIIAIDSIDQLICDTHNAFKQLKAFYDAKKDWLFGYLSYETKEQEYQGEDSNLRFPKLSFIQPAKIIYSHQGVLFFDYHNTVAHLIESDYQQILQTKTSCSNNIHIQKKEICARVSKQDYLQTINQIKENIHRGDIYEMNFCCEFYIHTSINPLESYFKLNEESTSPFSSYLKFDNLYILSSSPERYLKKNGPHLISQPIKGTATRGTNPQQDKAHKKYLSNDTKERAENIMVTDLVRNDLSVVAQRGTVKVEELCKTYTFQQVHQLISTVSCQVSPHKHPVDIIRDTFPMASMTGVPKIRVIQLIKQYESTARGPYSGALGYIAPNGDFDFSVVIRSILYNAHRQYVSYSAGGAITHLSVAEQEYQEILTKTELLKKILLGE